MKRKKEAGVHERRELRIPLPDKKTAYIILAALAVAALAIFAIVLAASADGRDYKSYMTRAGERYDAGDYDSALSDLRKAAQINESDECLMLMADCYEAQGRLEKALEVLRRLDTTQDAVARRIAAVEQKRSQQLEAEKLVIAGKSLSLDASDVALNSLELTTESLAALNKLKSLEHLSLMDNGLSDISPLSELGGLTQLNLSGNSIKDISALKGLTGLRKLCLDGNPVRDLTPVLSLTNLTVLSIRGIRLSGEQLERLSLTLPSCAIYSDADDEDAVQITLGGVSFRPDVTELDLSGRDIRDISALADCQELKKLDLSGNQIYDLCPLMNLPALEQLDISENQVSDLRPLMGMSTLRSVNASGNQVSSTVSVGSMNALTELDLSGNPISDFSGLKKLRNLQSLGLRDCGVTDQTLEDLAHLVSLGKLELDGNPELSGEAVDGLQRALGSCVISHSELVYSVLVDGYSIKANATELDLGGTGISDLSGIGNLGYLQTVKLGSNNISNIYIFQHTASFDDITYLDLSSNQIEDITPVASLTALETLNLSGNKVNSILPLMQMQSLKTLNLKGNPLTQEQIDTLSASLTNCQIIWE